MMKLILIIIFVSKVSSLPIEKNSQLSRRSVQNSSNVTSHYRSCPPGTDVENFPDLCIPARTTCLRRCYREKSKVKRSELNQYLCVNYQLLDKDGSIKRFRELLKPTSIRTLEDLDPNLVCSPQKYSSVQFNLQKNNAILREVRACVPTNIFYNFVTEPVTTTTIPTTTTIQRELWVACPLDLDTEIHPEYCVPAYNTFRSGCLEEQSKIKKSELNQYLCIIYKLLDKNGSLPIFELLKPVSMEISEENTCECSPLKCAKVNFNSKKHYAFLVDVEACLKDEFINQHNNSN